jgi:mannan endo-1,4-beta-mannosidase
VAKATLVDELVDFSKVNSQSGGWKIADRNCRSAKEDAYRAAGVAGDVLVYRLPNSVQSFHVFAFFPKEESAVKFSISDDGQNFHEVAAQKEIYFHGAGEYGYWKPVLFLAEKIHGGNFLKIELTGETQIGRVEISHPALSP